MKAKMRVMHMYIQRRLYQIKLKCKLECRTYNHACEDEWRCDDQFKGWSRSMFGLGLVACRILSASSVFGVTLPEWLTGSPAKVI